MKQITLDYQPIEWLGDRVKFLDQTRLPDDEMYIETKDYLEIVAAIKELKVRGAPLIGVAGAYGMALASLHIYVKGRAELLRRLKDVADNIGNARPTARNLMWAVERMLRVAVDGKTIENIRQALVAEATAIHEQEAGATYKMAENGAEFVNSGMNILTHCNTGPLAATGLGTALGVIINASRQGKKIHVYADETRPLLQGARLTAWELNKVGVPATLITDSTAGYLMQQGKVDAVLVGADRISANGDTANKIGTYTLAVLARENSVPFYVVAPSSTFDLSIADGSQITIELRNPNEVTRFGGISIAPEGTDALSPAFDITPAKYITAFVTERGIIRQPLTENLLTML
ncbi:MAG: S-methyl-5-thioribose-1-phosphate isomerase [Dehalococcoidales bacterium]|nr:S-methyl-5-thioribose-1-phosphate isomerase [Dehalococcoidales bacterium]